MYLHKRGRVWWSEFTRKGVRHQFSTGKLNKAEAAEFVEKLMASTRAPDYENAVKVLRAVFSDTATPQVQLKDAWTKYENTAAALGRWNLSDTSVRKRKSALARFITWLDDNHPNITTADQISSTLAAEYAQTLARIGRTAKTRINIIGDLGSVWNVLEKVSDEIHNPWKHLNPKNVGGKRLDAFSKEQEDAILDAAKKVGKDWYPVCMLLRHTGLRYHDVAQLRWSEIFGLDAAHASASPTARSSSAANGNGSAVNLTSSAANGNGSTANGRAQLGASVVEGVVIRVKPKKTTRHGITVAIPLIEEAAKALIEIRDDGRKGDYCFPVHAAFWGKGGRKRRVLNFQEVTDLAGVSGNFTIHSWRHTAATRLADAGVDIETRMRILGHTVKDTARLYDHAEHLDESRAAIERAAII